MMTSKDELRLQVGHKLHDYGVRGQDNDYLTDYILNLLEGEKLKAILDGEERGYKKGFDEAMKSAQQALNAQANMKYEYLATHNKEPNKSKE